MAKSDAPTTKADPADSNKDMVVLIADETFTPYKAGEVFGFPKEVADKILEKVGHKVHVATKAEIKKYEDSVGTVPDGAPVAQVESQTEADQIVAPEPATDEVEEPSSASAAAADEADSAKSKK